MSIARMTDVGVAAAEAAVQAADRAPADPDAALLRLALFEFLRAFAAAAEEHMDDAGESAELLAAYRGWLDTAAKLFDTGDTSLLREYAHKRALLLAEMELEAADMAGTATATG